MKQTSVKLLERLVCEETGASVGDNTENSDSVTLVQSTYTFLAIDLEKDLYETLVPS